MFLRQVASVERKEKALSFRLEPWVVGIRGRTGAHVAGCLVSRRLGPSLCGTGNFARPAGNFKSPGPLKVRRRNRDSLRRQIGRAETEGALANFSDTFRISFGSLTETLNKSEPPLFFVDCRGSDPSNREVPEL